MRILSPYIVYILKSYIVYTLTPYIQASTAGDIVYVYSLALHGLHSQALYTARDSADANSDEHCEGCHPCIL